MFSLTLRDSKRLLGKNLLRPTSFLRILHEMYALRYAKDKVINVVVVVLVVEVEIAVVAIVVEVVILTLIVHNWTFYPGRFLACL